MKSSKLYLLLLFLIFSCTKISETTMMHADTVYKNKDLPLFLPFKFEIDPMERLLLVNFEKDPDTEYIGLEPQFFQDSINGQGLLVIAWRTDMKIDVYHENSLFPNKDKFDIAGNGLGSMHQVKFVKKRFEISQNGVDTDILFKDKLGRPIEIIIKESNLKKRKPFGLLAPMGDAASYPSAMPLILLHDFYFVRRRQTEISVKINGQMHQADHLPIPMDGSFMYFARYSPDPFIVTFNPAYSGLLSPKDEYGSEVMIEVNGHAKEIKRYSKEGDGHQIGIEFSPAFPQFNLLQPNQSLHGNFCIRMDESIGMIKGEYHISTKDDIAIIELIPSGGWHPKIDKFSLRFLYTMVKTFKNWPKTYLWSATLKEQDQQWFMESNWTRIRD